MFLSKTKQNFNYLTELIKESSEVPPEKKQGYPCIERNPLENKTLLTSNIKTFHFHNTHFMGPCQLTPFRPETFLWKPEHTYAA